jgi:hypothetical protein
MAITMPVTMTTATREALLLYCDNLAENGQAISANLAAGELLSEALRLYGFMTRSERAKTGGE